jgi:IPT/TIG domain-containing protein
MARAHRSKLRFFFWLAFLFLPSMATAQQAAPPASGARILLAPRRMISGEHATLAVLDVNGRLTPGVTIQFSNGDKVTTDQTGRALFVAPLMQGALFASIAGRPGRVATAILPATSANGESSIELAPRVASISDRFELVGNGFCGDADKNEVTIGGASALVLASSPNALTVLPPPDFDGGAAEVKVACGKHQAGPVRILFVSLKLEADTSALQAGQKRTLRVSVAGTHEKILLEARNLAPEICDLAAGNPARTSSSGGAENSAEFQVTGKKHGNFLISIRLVPTMAKAQR